MPASRKKPKFASADKLTGQIERRRSNAGFGPDEEARTFIGGCGKRTQAAGRDQLPARPLRPGITSGRDSMRGFARGGFWLRQRIAEA
mgnify:CR=1 FL=1